MVGKEMYVQLLSGRDVCEVESQALITAVDSKGIWCGKVDIAIRDKVGSHFHQALMGYMRQKTGLTSFGDGQTFEVMGDVSIKKAKFNNIVFVIDDCKEPLSLIVEKGLKKANEEGYELVSMSAIRAGESFGRKEESFKEMAEEVSKGISDFLEETDDINIKRLLILTYDKEDYKSLLTKEFGKKNDILTVV